MLSLMLPIRSLINIICIIYELYTIKVVYVSICTNILVYISIYEQHIILIQHYILLLYSSMYIVCIICVCMFIHLCVYTYDFFFSLTVNILVQVRVFIMLLRRSCSPLQLINTLSPCFIYFLPPLLIIWEMLWLFPSLSARSGSVSLPVCPAPGSLPYCEVGGKLFSFFLFFQEQ